MNCSLFLRKSILPHWLVLIPLVVSRLCGPLAAEPAPQTDPNQAAREWDVVVYGGTSAAVIAAVQAKRMGKSVILVCPDKHLGGLTSGGLGWTDTGDKSVIGGLSRDFYHRIWVYYQQDTAWKWQRQDEYGNRGQGTAAVDGRNARCGFLNHTRPR